MFTIISTPWETSVTTGALCHASTTLIASQILPPGCPLSTITRSTWGSDGYNPIRSCQHHRELHNIAVLSPLSGSGDLLIIKIPLSDGGYYLVENRQQIGFDRMLPDSGILILKVDPNAPEGHGTVKIMNADPSTGKFVKAVYRLEESNRNIFKERIIAEALRAFRESNFEKSVSIAGQEY